MLRFCFRVAVFVTVIFLATPVVKATCSAGLIDPLYLLDSTVWTFQTTDVLDGAIGTFQAHVQQPTAINPYLTGVLDVTATTNAVGLVTVKQKSVGRYQMNPDCNGGRLYFHLNGNAFQYAFLFDMGGTEMVLLSANNSVPNYGAGPFIGSHGTATPLTQFGCPAGLPDSLYLLNNTSWVFQYTKFFAAAIGTFTAQVQLPNAINPFLTGTLTGTVTTSGEYSGSGTTDGAITGRYQMDEDCAGGILYLNNGTNPDHYYFIFANNPTRMLLLSDGQLNSNSLMVVGTGGVAKPM